MQQLIAHVKNIYIYMMSIFCNAVSDNCRISLCCGTFMETHYMNIILIEIYCLVTSYIPN